MPEGALGPIIKPMDWRRHNDSKLFTRDWSSFIRPLKIRRRILMAYRQALIEREKNQARKWWFYISKYERDCWIGRRADGEFPNIAIQAGFTGSEIVTDSISVGCTASCKSAMSCS
jgi:hypothetical protein